PRARDAGEAALRRLSPAAARVERVACPAGARSRPAAPAPGARAGGGRGAAVVWPAAGGTAHADPQSLLQAGHRVSAHSERERPPLLSADLRAAVWPPGGRPHPVGALGGAAPAPRPRPGMVG